MRLCRIQLGHLPGEHNQFLGIGHGSRPSWLVDASGVGLSEEIEVGKNPPCFERTNLLNDRLRDSFGERKELGTRHGVINDDDFEENGRFSAPIVPKRRLYAHHLRRQWNARDSRQKLCLLNECPCDVHPFIIAYAKHRWLNPLVACNGTVAWATSTNFNRPSPKPIPRCYHLPCEVKNQI